MVRARVSRIFSFSAAEKEIEVGRIIALILIAVAVGFLLWGLAKITERGADATRRDLAQPDRQSDDLDTILGADYVNSLQRAKAWASEAEIRSIRTAFVQYYLTYNEYPGSIEKLVEKGFIDRNALSDPWFQDYRYEVEGNSLTITSPGQDRIRNTSDDVQQVIPLQ